MGSTGKTSSIFSKSLFGLLRNAPPSEETVEFNARVHTASERKQDTESITLLIRDGADFVAVCVNSKEVASSVWEVAQTCTIESILRVSGTLTPSGNNLQLNHAIQGIDDISSKVIVASGLIPVSLAVDGLVDRSFQDLKLNEGLNNQILDMRSASKGAVFRLMSGLWELTVEHCLSEGLMWLSTPNIIGYKTPGDNDYFPVSYFDHKHAYLAQTCEYHHQMAFSMDFLPGIFEIRTMFRQEHRVSKRHLTEFTSLETAFTIKQDWVEIVDKVDTYIVFVISQLQKRERFQHLTSLAKKIYPSAGNFKLGLDAQGKLPRLKFSEAKKLLNDNDQLEDFNPTQEATLGRMMRSNPPSSYPQTDVFIITEYPKSLRPFNVHPSTSTSETTNSFDVIIRGQETSSGWQFQHDYQSLLAAMRANDPPVDPDDPTMKSWLTAYEAGVHPYGGYGIGLNRLLQGFLGMDDVHDTAIFPRDAQQLIP
ncbi:aspartate-tRNA ligase [Annulohypoxylon nitens]|nr:aspartate-tRNA ligase [Annulohypoxylon nitens]